MAPKSVTFQRHDHLVSVLFGDLLSHSYNNTFSMFLYLVLVSIECRTCLSSPRLRYPCGYDCRQPQSVHSGLSWMCNEHYVVNVEDGERELRLSRHETIQAR